MAALVALKHVNDDPASHFLFETTQAAALFLRDGIEAVRMTDIAAVSGVGVATLYRRYKTKTALAVRAGTYMWQCFNERIHHMIDEDAFLIANGGRRLTMLLEKYIDSYTAYPDFVRFIDEFDHLVLAEGIEPQNLKEYGESIDSFYPIFEDAYQLGIDDGSICREVDFPVLYRTIAHAMMGIAQHLVRGEVIPSDDFSTGTDELLCVVQMARFALGITDVE